METTTIEMLGREYYISDVDATTANLKLTLLDTANSVTVTEGETQTVTLGDKTYEIGIVGVEDANTAVLSVDGQKISSLDEGQSRKIADDTYLSVKDVIYNSKDSGVSSVEVSVGTGQIVVEDNQNLEINSEQVDDITVDLTSSSGQLSQIKFTWANDDEEFLVPGTELVMPGFEVIKLSMAGFVVAEPESFELKNSGDDRMEIKNFEVADGTISTLPILYANSSKTGFSGLGKDSDERLVTSTSNLISLNESKDKYFAVTYQSGDDSESYVFELISVNEEDSGVKNVTKIKNLATDQTTEFSATDLAAGDDIDFGDINIKINNTNGDLGTASVIATKGGSSTGVTFDRIITEKGLAFTLPIDGVTGWNVLNISGAQSNTTDTIYEPNSWVMNFTEGDEDNNNFGIAAGGQSFTATVGFTGTSNKIEIDTHSVSTKLALDEDSDHQESYVGGSGSHATKLVLRDADQDYLEVEYHGVEAYADVLVAESSAVVSSDGNSTSTGVVVLKDSEASSASGKNLVVVGGSCVNTVAADLLGLSSGACGADWETATGVGTGSYLIQTFSRTGGKVATLVAGYTAGDTTNAAKAFTTQNVDATAGKKYTGTVATAITMATV
jgi:hypothetical protein